MIAVGPLMGDFSQFGRIPTLHRLGDRPAGELERDLISWSASRPMALVIPALVSELEGPALRRIVEELGAVEYLSEIIIGIDQADRAGFDGARQFFSALPQRHRLLWHHGPRLQTLDGELRKLGVAPTDEGKGRNVWFCFGYFLASGRASVVALHDADVLTYDRRMLARLLYPVVHPTFGYAFAKGYYYRTDGHQLTGRVVRLFMEPLLRAFTTVLGPNDYIDYLAGFRYPLAGEAAMHADVVRNMRIPDDWGLEVGVLAEVYRRYTPRRICQVEIADAYDHKHQRLSGDDPTAGIHKMAIDIGKAMFRKLAIDGAVFTPATFRSLKAAYYREALDLVEVHHNNAVINGLHTDRHLEERTVDVFAEALVAAGEAYVNHPMDTPFIASWARVLSAMPDVFERLREAVEADAADSD